jgi:ubiquinone/menaquinone biosynthesis C-methylase UbiE
MIKSKIGSKEQYKYWNSLVYYWLKYDLEINKKFTNITKLLFSCIDFSNNKLVLDVGCGSGFTTKIISDSVNDSCKVIGMDLSAPMLNLLEKKYKKTSNINTIQADAQNFYFKKKSIDSIISRFGLMFFNNPFIAFKNLNSALKNKGSISFVCWTDFTYNQFFSIPVKILKEVTGLKKESLSRKPGPFAFNNKNYISNILTNSNFNKIKIKTVKTILTADNIIDDIDIFMKIGIAAKIMRENNLNKKVIAKVKNSLKNYLLKYIYNKTGYYKAKVFLVTAVKQNDRKN